MEAEFELSTAFSVESIFILVSFRGSPATLSQALELLPRAIASVPLTYSAWSFTTFCYGWVLSASPPSFSSGNCIHSLTNFFYRKQLLKARAPIIYDISCWNACYSLLRERWSHQEFLLFLLWGGTSSLYPWLREYWHSSQDTKPLRVDEFR